MTEPVTGPRSEPVDETGLTEEEISILRHRHPTTFEITRPPTSVLFPDEPSPFDDEEK